MQAEAQEKEIEEVTSVEIEDDSEGCRRCF